MKISETMAMVAASGGNGGNGDDNTRGNVKGDDDYDEEDDDDDASDSSSLASNTSQELSQSRGLRYESNYLIPRGLLSELSNALRSFRLELFITHVEEIPKLKKNFETDGGTYTT